MENSKIYTEDGVTINSEKFAWHEILLAFHREDYYTILRNKKYPEDRVSIRWQGIKTKHALAMRFHLL